MLRMIFVPDDHCTQSDRALVTVDVNFVSRKCSLGSLIVVSLIISIVLEACYSGENIWEVHASGTCSSTGVYRPILCKLSVAVLKGVALLPTEISRGVPAWSGVEIDLWGSLDVRLLTAILWSPLTTWIYDVVILARIVLTSHLQLHANGIVRHVGQIRAAAVLDDSEAFINEWCVHLAFITIKIHPVQ